jgi:hypothetical protein
MTKQDFIRADSSDIRRIFEEWIRREGASGARLVVLEGLMQSGKSFLTDKPVMLDGRPSDNIELDQFVPRETNPDIEYMLAIDSGMATAAMRQAMETAPLVIAEGPMAWPVTEIIRAGMPADSIRRAYLKRLSPRNPDEWEVLEFAQEHPRPTEFGRSIDRYHVKKQPWLLADLILERTGHDMVVFD